MDYEKAITNLHNILIHEDKFAEINKSIFDAIDTDNSGTLEREEVESFVKSLLVGIHNEEEEEYDQNERHRIVFGVLDENESGEITLDELGKFLRELFKEQIKELQDASERLKRKNQNKQGTMKVRTNLNDSDEWDRKTRCLVCVWPIQNCQQLIKFSNTIIGIKLLPYSSLRIIIKISFRKMMDRKQENKELDSMTDKVTEEEVKGSATAMQSLSTANTSN